jgi:hypothetical protein
LEESQSGVSLGNAALARLAALIGRPDWRSGNHDLLLVLFGLLLFAIASLLAFGHDVLLMG